MRAGELAPIRNLLTNLRESALQLEREHATPESVVLMRRVRTDIDALTEAVQEREVAVWSRENTRV